MRTKSVIKQLYNENRRSGRIPQTPEYAQAKEEANKALAEYLKKLPKDEFKEFDKLCDIMNDEQAEECFCNFAEGFKLGLRMGIEVMGE